ncbi:hypothetical protein Tco_0750767 [Tanacetum coccineum]|uniref:Retrotransposon gag domain-containing protein n=1 Tax=Tanacetum coccineum TaxID=301880 RepID=A0ABQ4Z4S1_9ASTR
MKFVVQNFKQINAMYSAFFSKRKEVNPTLAYNNDDHLVIEPWRSDSKGSPEEVIRRAPEETTLQVKPSKKSRFTTKNIDNLPKQRPVSNDDFYNKPFTFTEHKRMYATWWHHLSRRESETMTCQMGSSVHGNYGRAQAARAGLMSFLSYYSEWSCPVLTQAEILGIRQRSDESLRDYLGRFGKETLHMTDRSDGMMMGAFISGLCLGRLFKDLIARPPASMEDLFMQAHNFIRSDEANTKNQLRDGRWGITKGRHVTTVTLSRLV